MWSEAERRYLDISTLELVAVAFLVVVAGTYAGLAGSRFIVRCDNEAACNVANRMAPSKPHMEAALRLLDQAMRATNIQIILEHIPGKRNRIADAYSRGAHAEGDELVATLCGEDAISHTIPQEWRHGEGMRAITAAGRRTHPRGITRGVRVV